MDVVSDDNNARRLIRLLRMRPTKLNGQALGNTNPRQIFPTIDSLPTKGLTQRTLLPDRFFWASRFFTFFIRHTLSCLLPYGRLSWLLVSFQAHVSYRIVSYRIWNVLTTGDLWPMPLTKQDKRFMKCVKREVEVLVGLLAYTWDNVRLKYFSRLIADLYSPLIVN